VRAIRDGSLIRRLVLVQCVVIAAMAVTVIVTAGLFGPMIFDEHMREAGHGEQLTVMVHAQEAFRIAGLSAMGIGLTIAVIGAVLASVLLARRIGARLRDLTRGAERVARGAYDEPVRVSGAGDELDTLAGAFNGMSEQIGATEATRRRMLTDLAHEMRTPIAAIEVTLESLEDGVVPLDDEFFGVIRDQTHRLTRLSRDIRDVSAAEEGRLDLHREAVDARDLASRAVAAATGATQAVGVNLHTRLPSAALQVFVDPARIGQVLDNLLRNARQHTPEGGAITVTVHEHDHLVEIHVSDTGAGITENDLPHIFERFYRADTGRHRDAQTGTGVGLSISQAIAVAHGGSLRAESAGVGRGATFTLTLPVVAS